MNSLSKPRHTLGLSLFFPLLDCIVSRDMAGQSAPRGLYRPRMRQTIVNTMYHQTYKHTKNTFCSSPLSRALLLHASTSPIVLSRQNPSISSFADHLCPLLPNSLHRPYVPVYIEDIVTVPTARQMSGDQTGLLIYFLTFPPKSIFYDTETKHIHV